MALAFRLAGVALLALGTITVSAQEALRVDGRPAFAAPAAATGGGVTAIEGHTLTAVSAPLPNATVRLRDVRSGRALETTSSDKTGMFVFRRLDPGSYVVELIARDQTILAASPLLNVNAGELVLTIVKLPLRLPAAGILSRTAPALLAVTAASAAAGVLASTVTGQPVSPVR